MSTYLLTTVQSSNDKLRVMSARVFVVEDCLQSSDDRFSVTSASVFVVEDCLQSSDDRFRVTSASVFVVEDSLQSSDDRFRVTSARVFVVEDCLQSSNDKLRVTSARVFVVEDCLQSSDDRFRVTSARVFVVEDCLQSSNDKFRVMSARVFVVEDCLQSSDDKFRVMSARVFVVEDCLQSSDDKFRVMSARVFVVEDCLQSSDDRFRVMSARVFVVEDCLQSSDDRFRVTSASVFVVEDCLQSSNDKFRVTSARVFVVEDCLQSSDDKFRVMSARVFVVEDCLQSSGDKFRVTSARVFVVEDCLQSSDDKFRVTSARVFVVEDCLQSSDDRFRVTSASVFVVEYCLPLRKVMQVLSVQATFVKQIQLSQNGKILSESQLPACLDGRIKLLSYKYCHHVDQCDSQSTELSSAEEETIHRMCSLKSKCSHPKMPLKNGQEVLQVSYDCLEYCITRADSYLKSSLIGIYTGCMHAKCFRKFADMFDSFIKMCQNGTFSGKKLLRLAYNQNAESFEKCECNVTGRVQLTLEDVRLRAFNSDRCSQAMLEVNSRVYQCDEENAAEGALFHKLANRQQNTRIIFTPNSPIIKPEMIYMTLKPDQETSFNGTCETKPIMIVRTTTESAETKVTESDEKYIEASTNSSSVSGSIAMVAVGSVVTLLLVLVCVAVWLIRRNREKRRRIEHLENLIANRNNQQPVHLRFQNSGAYSLARDVKPITDDGDYIGLLRGANVRRDGTDNCGDHQTREDEADTALATRQCGTNYVNTKDSKSNRKWWQLKSPKQNTAVYSYATQEFLLRDQSGAGGSFESEAASTTASGTTKQSLNASNTVQDNYYFKLLPIEESTKCSLGVGPTEAHFKRDDKKSRKKQKQNKKANNQTEDPLAKGSNLGLQYIEDHYAFPKVDVTEQSKAMPISDKNKADNKQEEEQSANRYETIDINYSLDSQCQDKPKSTGIFKTIVNIIFKPSNQNANTAHKDENERTLHCHNEGSVLKLDAVDISFKSKRRDAQLAAQNLGVDKYDSTTIHKKMDSVDPKYDHLCSQKTPMSNHLQRKTDTTAKRTWSPSEKEFGKKSITSQPTEHGIGKDKARHIRPGSADNSDDRDSDDDHYDKFTVDQKFQQKHPNYDKVSKAMNTTFKSLFRKHSAKMDI